MYREKQERLEKIREKLHAQMQQKIDDEDDRIGRALEEAEERHQREESKKAEWSKKMYKEMAQNRAEQVGDNRG